MVDNSETCVFRWHVQNPFLPSETKEAIFCFRSPKVTQWKAFLQRGTGRRAVNNWPVSFSLQYFPPDKADKEVLEVDVSVDFEDVGNEIPSSEHFVFKQENNYTYKYDSSIRPEHGELEIDVKICIPRRYKEVFEFAPNHLESLSNDLKRLRSEPLYFDMWLQSKDPATKFPVHSYILDVRWDSLFKVLEVTPNPDDPPTVETDILPDVLDDILTYLYSGSLMSLHLRDPEFEDHLTELFQTIDKYPLHHAIMTFDTNLRRQTRKTMTRLSTSAMTFRLVEADELGPYVWTHSPLPGVSVTTSLRFFDYVPVQDGLSLRPSLSYTLKITNFIKLSARVNLEYRRKVLGWDSETRRILYECDHEIPCNGTEVVSVPITPTSENPFYLLSFIEGGDRREGRHVIEHSFRFILYFSTGEKSIKVTKWIDLPDYDCASDEKVLNSDEEDALSFRILSKHMSNMRRREKGVGVRVTPEDFGVSMRYPEIWWYDLHKAILAVRIPKWKNVIEVVPEDDNIPGRLCFMVSNKALKCIIDYIYTGTCSYCPDYLHDEIFNFALRAGFSIGE